jgi:hypothetical protein
VPLAEIGAEFLFQVIAERAEQAAVILTTNLPLSEWTQVIANPRLCKALLDRITDRAHILETGTETTGGQATNPAYRRPRCRNETGGGPVPMIEVGRGGPTRARAPTKSTETRQAQWAVPGCQTQRNVRNCR